MPTILAIETSSERASCALLRDGRLSTRASEGVRTHSQAILPMVQDLLADAGIVLADCDAIAYGAGPGSFTGVRTATGIAQGLGFGSQLPVVAVVTLEAMAESCRQQDAGSAIDDVLAVLDARMGEVYWARYQWTDESWQIVDAPALAAPAAVPAPGQAVVCGNGVAAYADAFSASWGADAVEQALARAAVMPDAGAVAMLGARAFADGGAVKADQAQPLYLRNKIAFTSAERQVINAQKAAAA